MKIRKYIKDLSILILVLVAIGMVVYKSLADENNQIETVKEKEEVIDDKEDFVEEGNVEEEVKEKVDEDKETEYVEEVNEGVIDDEEDFVEKDIGNEDKESVKSVKVSLDKSLPKLVGVDIVKKNIVEDVIPLLPGFKKSGDMYICDVKNKYDTTIRMYKITESANENASSDKIIVMTGSEVMTDKQVQQIVSIIINYYENKKWEFIYNGDHSYFEINL